uniref:Uncharacterized protein n=1 Tax=Pristionchus pacificus TaxID=54126 RepID=A0A2A6BQF2_PRIPA|eukprot:PDM68140.1 hypothetical protein PRIPAC_46184 [Pristionchus pacificus]
MRKTEAMKTRDITRAGTGPILRPASMEASGNSSLNIGGNLREGFSKAAKAPRTMRKIDNPKTRQRDREHW